MSDFLIPSHCHKCGTVGESKLTWAGPHIKQSCDDCGFYQRFIDKRLIPDVREIKIAIWGKTNDLALIEEIKKECGFVGNLKGLDAKLQYYKLYKAVVKKLSGAML
jgi:hypothetical protein